MWCCLLIGFGCNVNLLLIWFLFKGKWWANKKEALQQKKVKKDVSKVKSSGSRKKTYVSDVKASDKKDVS